MRTQKLIMIILNLFFIILFSGCTIKGPPPHPIKYYTLDYQAPAMEPVPTLPLTLSLEKFKTAPPFDSNRIIYSKNKYSQNKYFYHQWMSVPDEMIARLLARDLISSHRFSAIMVSGDVFTNYQLGGTIDEIFEQDTDSQWNAVLSITINLMNKNEKAERNRIRFQKTYKKILPLDQNNPKGLTRALSMAMSEISKQIISDIYHELQ